MALRDLVGECVDGLGDELETSEISLELLSLVKILTIRRSRLRLR